MLANLALEKFYIEISYRHDELTHIKNVNAIMHAFPTKLIVICMLSIYVKEHIDRNDAILCNLFFP